MLNALAANPEHHALLEALVAAVPSLQQLPGPSPQQLPGSSQEGGFPGGEACQAQPFKRHWHNMQAGFTLSCQTVLPHICHTRTVCRRRSGGLCRAGAMGTAAIWCQGE